MSQSILQRTEELLRQLESRSPPRTVNAEVTDFADSVLSAITTPPRLPATPKPETAAGHHRRDTDEVVELRKALLAATEAVFSGQQELRVLRQKNELLQQERDRAVLGIKSLHSMLAERQISEENERRRCEASLREAKDQLESLQGHLATSEAHCDSLRSQLAAERSRYTECLDELQASRRQVEELRSHLCEAVEYSRRKKVEVRRADAFVTGALTSFLREAEPFLSQWRVEEPSSIHSNISLEAESPTRHETSMRNLSDGSLLAGTRWARQV